ncbi:MAG TPA: DmsE family decaheme c-type cytochrome [Vicinamibacterales bacterium]|nr:DmsE family decaheme c-type cytochrome [Vicinamibacterales bacterium]
MGRFARRLSPAVSIAAALVVWVAVVVSVRASTVPRQQTNGAPAQVAADYVGEAKCVECHPSEGDSYKATPHGRPALERSPAATKGCESCHGPGRQHVENPDKSNIRRFTPGGLAPRDASEVCATCHNRGTHALWNASQHEQRNVGCATCHSVHNWKGEKQLKAATQPELCATCHRNVVNRLYRFNHMPAREGKISCSSCHNPHGSANVKLLKAGTTVDEACTSCHHEKRGPYLWEHAPVANACVTCHDPHGSNNERMLVAKVPFLCQRCHVTSRHPPTVYDAFALKNSASANRLASMGCVNCHVQIHGSNSPSGKYFHR